MWSPVLLTHRSGSWKDFPTTYNLSIAAAGAKQPGLGLGTQQAQRAGDQGGTAAWLPTTAHLVCTDNEDNVLHVPMGAQLLLHLGQPRVQRVERLLLPDVVDQDDPLRVLVKLVPHLWRQRQGAGTSDSQAESTGPRGFGRSPAPPWFCDKNLSSTQTEDHRKRTDGGSQLIPALC